MHTIYNLIVKTALTDNIAGCEKFGTIASYVNLHNVVEQIDSIECLTQADKMLLLSLGLTENTYAYVAHNVKTNSFLVQLCVNEEEAEEKLATIRQQHLEFLYS